MDNFVSTALFVYSPDSEHLLDQIRQHAPNVEVQSLDIETFLANPDAIALPIEHLVVSAPMGQMKAAIQFAVKQDTSVGILPLTSQKGLIKFFRLPANVDEQIILAFQKNTLARDFITCNDHIVLFKATIGRLPVIDGSDNASRWNAIKRVFSRLKGIRLLAFKFQTAGGKLIETAASGCLLIQHHYGSLAANLIAHDSSSRDGMISMVVTAPLSILEYLMFLFEVLKTGKSIRKIPKTIGYIKTTELIVETESPLDVDIDGVSMTTTPVVCKVEPLAFKVNTGASTEKIKPPSKKLVEIVKVKNLPIGSELIQAKKKAIPFFSYASEERFKDLFVALREDARTNSAYVVLMILSTVLATLGLYLNSTSVVIGAMLLAPLMSPIVSIAMGMLRFDNKLYRKSAVKIAVGISIALISAALITLLFPHKPVTDEMLGRLSPSLLDLGVAIFAGIAGAYTKAYKEILQGLAGVAIAVALVPPLAVAGVGLGRGDPYFFGQAFLLFSTNLIGIIFAASLTFRVLGYSAAIRGKRSIVYVAVLMAAITVPLYLTYDEIVEDLQFQSAWKKERFLINGKYIIVTRANRYEQNDRDVITMKILAREPLNRDDMNEFKKKIQANFSRKFVIRADVAYIL